MDNCNDYYAILIFLHTVKYVHACPQFRARINAMVVVDICDNYRVGVVQV